MDQSFIAFSRSADPKTMVHMKHQDQWATIWADLTENAGAIEAVAANTPATPVDQGAIDALFASAA